MFLCLFYQKVKLISEMSPSVYAIVHLAMLILEKIDYIWRGIEDHLKLRREAL